MTVHRGESEERSLFSPVNDWLEKVLESHTSANLLIIAVTLVASLPILGIGYFATRPIAPHLAIAEASPLPMEASVAAASVKDFSCKDGKRISALFSTGQVSLTLSDGRQVALPQVRSGAGTWYGNADDSFVFWFDGANAHLEENSVQTYANCASK